MKIKTVVLTGLIGAATTLNVSAADKSATPLEQYQLDVASYMEKCSVRFENSLSYKEMYEVIIKQGQEIRNRELTDYAGCIREGLDVSKASFNKALSSVKKTTAREALKSYHVAFVTTLQGISPGANERRSSYDQRQQALMDKLNEARARFEIEQ